MTDLQPVVHSKRVERAVLSVVLLDPRIYSSIRGKITASSFYNETHRKIWRAICDICDADKRLDIMSMIDRLDEKGDLESVGGPPGINKATNEVPSAGVWQPWVEKLHTLANQRQLCAEIDSIRHQLADRDVDHVEIAQRLKLACDASMDSTTTSEGVSMIDADEMWEERFEDDLAGNGQKPYRTGLYVVDQRLGGGFHLGRSVVIAGLPKMGKTKLTTALVGGALKQALNDEVPLSVDWYTAEMTVYEMQCRMISWASGIPEEHLRRPKVYSANTESPDYRRRIKAARELLRRMDITWHFGNPKLSDIVMNTRRKADRLGHNKFFNVVDYLQRIDGTATGPSAEYQNITNASKTMTGLVKEIGFGLVWVAQFNRGAAQNMEDIPKISQLRGSGQIEQDADEILVCHRPFAFEKSEPGYDMDRKRFMYLDLQASRHSQNETEVARANLGINQFDVWKTTIPVAEKKPWQS